MYFNGKYVLCHRLENPSTTLPSRGLAESNLRKILQQFIALVLEFKSHNHCEIFST